jgi:hypothetical protein
LYSVCRLRQRISQYNTIFKLITGFDENLWAALVDSMTVYAKDRIVFRLTCGMEIET